MPTSVYEHFDVPEIINAVGYATRVGGSCPAPAILEAMTGANRAYVEIDDLQAAASKQIARHTGAEAGIVTCGAAAALSLAGAACLVGADPDLMDRLPDTSACNRSQIIYPQSGPYEYDHAIRVCGAQLIELDYRAADSLANIEAAIGPKTAAIGYAWLGTDERPSIEALAQLAHRHQLPLIVDAAMALPPADNLHRFITCGADLVAISGGKHLGGPQASGILCGREDLIRSAWVQMVDMDVRAGTWSLHHLVKSGWISRPPRHGIGRSMKVGKEGIIGLMAALQAYEHRDHAAELEQWHAHIDRIAAGLDSVAGLDVTRLFPAPNGQPFPALRVRLPRGHAPLTIQKLIEKLRQQRPKIILAEHETDGDVAFINPTCLRDEDADRIAEVIRAILG